MKNANEVRKEPERVTALQMSKKAMDQTVGGNAAAAQAANAPRIPAGLIWP